MNTNNKLLHRLTILYIYIPVIIFLFGWCNIYAAGITLIGILYTFIKINSDSEYMNTGDNIKISPVILIAAFLTVLAVLILIGVGGVFPQPGDYAKHNAVLRDLVTHSWPVYYTEAEESMLTYYLGQYLLPALAGKVYGGFDIANAFTLIWAIVGVCLVYINLIRVTEADTRAKKLIALIVMFFFSGALPLCQILLSLILKEGFYSLLNYHWVLTTDAMLQYRSNTVMLRWVLPQVIVAWLVAELLYESRIREKYFCFFIIPVALFGAFSFASLCIAAIILAFIHLIGGKCRVWDVFSIYNIISAFSLGIIIAIYLWGNVSMTKPVSSSLRLQGFKGRELWTYICFILIMVGIYLICIFKENRKKPLYYITAFILLAAPFFRMGLFNDVVMSSTIPVLFILMIMLLSFLFNENGSEMAKGVIIVLICIGMIYPIAELADNIHENEKGMNIEDSYYTMEYYSDRENEEIQEDLKYNYFSYDLEKNQFVGYLARNKAP
ncbi:MAG: hypothetical protein SOX95_06695 [Lachnospiraceae bacterium]|nr:hypothetical protein [Lachnospiraceae bacterium]